MRFLRTLTRLFWAAASAGAGLLIVGYLAFLAWREFGPRKPVPNAVRRELAELVLPVIVDDLRQFATNYAGVVVLHLANDPTDHLTDRLRSLLGESGTLTVAEPMLDEKVQRALNLPVSSVDALNVAVARARGLGAPAVVFGRVQRFEGTPQYGHLALELQLADIAAGQVVFTRTYQRTWKPMPLEPAVLQEAVGRTHAASRLLGWALAVMLLPLFTIPFLRATVRRGSNRANAGTLILYTLIASLLAYLVVGANLESLWSLLILAGLTFAAFAYHVWIMTVALRLEES